MEPLSFKRHRFPAEVIRHAVWLYARFTLSFRDVEELLAERGLEVSHKTVHRTSNAHTLNYEEPCSNVPSWECPLLANSGHERPHKIRLVKMCKPEA